MKESRVLRGMPALGTHRGVPLRFRLLYVFSETTIPNRICLITPFFIEGKAAAIRRQPLSCSGLLPLDLPDRDACATGGYWMLSWGGRPCPPSPRHGSGSTPEFRCRHQLTRRRILRENGDRDHNPLPKGVGVRRPSRLESPRPLWGGEG